MESAYYLTVVQGKNPGRRFLLGKGENLIGRWDPDRGAFPEVDLDEEDEDARISRRHAVLVVGESSCSIEDLGSLNGTFINKGSRLETGVSHVLNEGDQLHCGRVVLRFEGEVLSGE